MDWFEANERNSNISKKNVYWDDALKSYQYGFDLSEFHRKEEFHADFFKIGYKESYRPETQEFEDHFQKNVQKNIEVYIEVLFWKLFSIRTVNKDFDSGKWYNDAIDSVKNTPPNAFWGEIINCKNNFINNDYNGFKENFRKIANILKTDKMIIPSTFISLACPDTFPMIDRHVISWINKNFLEQSKNRKNKLERFNDKPTIETDFNAYIHWVKWSQDSAMILNNNISKYNTWRPRDIEMAIFSYQRQRKGDLLEILSYWTESEKKTMNNKIEEDNARARKKYLIGKYGNGFTLYELEEFERVFQSNIVDNTKETKELFKKIEREERQLQRELR